MFKCRGCPKEYKNVYNRSRHEKKHHPDSYSAARVNHQSTATDCEVVSNQAGRRPTAYKPGNNAKEESAQYREGDVTGSRRNEIQLSRNQNKMQAVKAARQNGTPEGPWGDENGRKDVGHKRGERNKVKLGNGAQGGPNPGSKGQAKEENKCKNENPYQREAEPPQAPIPQDPDTEGNKEV